MSASSESTALWLAAIVLAITSFSSGAVAQSAQQTVQVTTKQTDRSNPGVPPGDYNLTERSIADMNLPNLYDRDETWLKMPAGRVLGSSSGIGVDKDGKSIWVLDRCGGPNLCKGRHVAPIMKFDKNGRLVKAFGTDMLVYPHGLWVDPDGNIWVTDLQSNVESSQQFNADLSPGTVPNGADVLKFRSDGQLLLRLGTPGHYGNDETHFSQPSDVITAQNGDIVVVDSHDSSPSNNRVVKFNKDGKFIKAWSACGTGAAKNDCGHSLAMDSQGRVFVADRGNACIKIFDQDGNLQTEWKQFGKPSGLYIDKNDVLYAADSESSVREGNSYVRGVHIGSARTGKVTVFIPDVGGNPSPWFPRVGTTGPEDVVADVDGHVFIAQVQPGGQVARYTLKSEVPN